MGKGGEIIIIIIIIIIVCPNVVLNWRVGWYRGVRRSSWNYWRRRDHKFIRGGEIVVFCAQVIITGRIGWCWWREGGVERGPGGGGWNIRLKEWW